MRPHTSRGVSPDQAYRAGCSRASARPSYLQVAEVDTFVDLEGVAGRVLEPRRPERTEVVDVALTLHAREVVVVIELHAPRLEGRDRAVEVVDSPQCRG